MFSPLKISCLQQVVSTSPYRRGCIALSTGMGVWRPTCTWWTLITYFSLPLLLFGEEATGRGPATQCGKRGLAMTLRCSSRSSSLRHQKTRTSWPTRVVAKEIWELRCGVEAENAAQCFNVGLWRWKSRNEKSWVSKDSEDFTCWVVMHFGWFWWCLIFDCLACQSFDLWSLKWKRTLLLARAHHVLVRSQTHSI